VLDCAHGYQKEEDEDDEGEASCPRQNDSNQEARHKASCQEIDEEDSPCGEGCGQEESREKNFQERTSQAGRDQQAA
jgi:hypothetical protein